VKKLAGALILGITWIPFVYATPETDPELYVEEGGLKFPLAGYFDATGQEVIVNTESSNPVRTIVHELIHAYWRHMYEPRTQVTEELMCRCMETAMSDLSANNWELIKELRKETRANAARASA
jgi:hypothetical protein